MATSLSCACRRHRLTEPIGVGLLLRVVVCIVVCCRLHVVCCAISAARSRLRVVVCMCARNVPRFMRLFRHRARLRRAVRLVRWLVCCMERVFGCIFTRRPSACKVVTQSTQCVPRVPQGASRVPTMRQRARPCPHLRRDWMGSPLPTSAPGLGARLPHLHRDFGSLEQ